MDLLSWIPRTSPIGKLINGDPAGKDDDPAYAGLNENQIRLLKGARRADAYAEDTNRVPLAQERLRAEWAAEEKAREAQIARTIATGNQLAPEDIDFAAKRGMNIPAQYLGPQSSAPLNPDQQQIIGAAQKYLAPGGPAKLTPERIQYGAKYGEVSDLTGLYNASKPSLTNVNGVMVDTSNAANAERYIPNVGEGRRYNPETGTIETIGGYDDARARSEGRVAGATEGARQAATLQYAGAITGAQEGAKAQYDLVDVTLGDGTTIKLPRSVVLSGQTVQTPDGASQVPFMASRSPVAEGTDQGFIAANNRRIEAAQAGAQSAGTIKQNALLLRSLGDNIQGGNFAPLKGAGASLLKSLGVVGEDSQLASYAADVNLFGKIAGQQVLANIKQFGSNPTEGERKFAMELGQTVTDPQAVTGAVSAMSIAGANKAQDYWQFVQNYKGDPRKLDDEYKKASPYGRYGIFADPEMQSEVVRMGGKVQRNPKTGEIRIVLPDGSIVGAN